MNLLKDIELDVEVLIVVGATFGLKVGELGQRSYISKGQESNDLKDTLPLKSNDNYLVEGVPSIDLELDVPQRTLT